jgi:hypothetical protein
MGMSAGFGAGSPSGGGTPADFAALAAALINPWSNGPGVVISNQVALTKVKVSWVGADGKVVRDATGGFAQGEALTNLRGGKNGVYPSQMSLAVSLQSAFPGPSGRGRFYCPGVASKVLVNGKMTPTDADAIAVPMKAFLDQCNTVLSANGVGPIVVASGGSIVKSTPPALRKVTSVRVGDRFDVIRSRAGQLDEIYISKPVA